MITNAFEILVLVFLSLFGLIISTPPILKIIRIRCTPTCRIGVVLILTPQPVPPPDLLADLADMFVDDCFQLGAGAAENLLPDGDGVVQKMTGEGNFGTIEVDNRAGLILVRGNPLEDLTVIQEPLGVMAAGRCYSAEALAKWIEIPGSTK